MKDGGRLRSAHILPLLTISVRGSTESRKYASLKDMEVTRPLDMVDEMPRYVFLR